MNASANIQGNRPARLRLAVRGAVQGVGFRPFVHRLARELELAGWVCNSSQGVSVEVEGLPAKLEEFLFRIGTEKPPRSSIHSLEASWLDPLCYTGFEIRESDRSGEKTALVLPDIATCPDCLREIFNPANRRYHYPFTNCTNCGPRFSIMEALPYDRRNTSMKAFKMCPTCQAEYDNPEDRRFHAQPNACPVCGPRLEYWNAAGAHLSRGYDSLLAAAAALRRGQIVAVKGIGGFHLFVDARNEGAVGRLRERKHREEKPLALMFPTLKRLMTLCEISPLEERLLNSPEAPIVLLRSIADRRSQIACSVAPRNPNLGIMLPYTPLHHLLMAELGFPTVATSGNLSDEPICTDEHEALDRLRDIADCFLVHNRPIVRHVDDSIVRVMLDREIVLRRARGYAPLPITLKSQIRNPKSEIVLAVGAQLKNSIALAVGPQVFISQHLGDLETVQAHTALRHVCTDFQILFEARPDILASDMHPDYLSTKFAQDLAQASPPAGSCCIPAVRSNSGHGCAVNSQAGSLRHVEVQHHIAHIFSCMAENELEPPVLGVSWDGTGCGHDGTIWGGEFFRVTNDRVERVAHLRSFRLPGGDAAVKEPRRAALGLLHESAQGQDKAVLHTEHRILRAFSTAEQAGLRSALARGVNSPLCSSVGRLFDAVAAIVGLRQQTRFEGQAAMELEFALASVVTDEAYPLPLARGGVKSGSRKPEAELILDWSPMIEAILKDVEQRLSAGVISAKFHNALADSIVAVAKLVGEQRVALSGGCFQNRYLTERTVQRLTKEGFHAYWHQRVPPNDGGICLGQIVAARRANR